MIDLVDVSVTYDGPAAPTLSAVDVHVEEGELVLVVGPTGSGKTTLLRCLNGLVPHFTGGTLGGRVLVDGRDTRTHRPRDLADLVGFVVQDPLASFVTDTVEDEIAYGMETLGIDAIAMRRRVEETLDLLGLAELRDRPVGDLSGGQQQRVAIAAVLAAGPRVLVLDEPTSALDPTAAEEVLAALTRLVHDLGVTVVLAEHRLERVAQFADRLVHLPGDGRLEYGAPADLFARTTVAPPVVELGRLAGWDPLPLSVRDARRRAQPVRDRLAPTPPAPVTPVPTPGAPVVRASGVTVRYPDVTAVSEVDLTLRAGEVVALMGRNGSGKTSLLWALQGSGRRQGGSVQVDGVDPRSVGAAAARGLVGMVPQTPSDLLSHDTVAAELRQADRAGDARPAGARAGAGAGGPERRPAREILDELVPGVTDDTHPRDLSEGQRLALVLAMQLSAAPAAMLLDEPTRGLDYGGKQALTRIIARLAHQGRAVLVSTHDVEFVAETAHRVVVMADGDVVADGPVADVIIASPAFAPQVAKILAPLPYLTVAQAARALEVRTPVTDPTTSSTTSSTTAARRERRRPVRAGRPVRAVRLRPRSAVSIALATFLGLVAFLWPFVVTPGAVGSAQTAPLMFGILLVVVLAVVLAEVAEGGIDAKALAMLGVLSAIGAALRPLGAGTAGIETVFFTLVLAGRVFGAGFGLVLGCTTLFASALVTGGVGPWLPYQMFGAAWVGLIAGLLPRLRGRAEVVMLAAYGALSGYLYGFLLNLSFWPFALDPSSSIAYQPGAGLADQVRRYLLFDAATSLGWDTGRAVTTAVVILVVGPAVLNAFRRAARKAAFTAPVAFVPPDDSAVGATQAGTSTASPPDGSWARTSGRRSIIKAK